jgi:O-antigen ligase
MKFGQETLRRELELLIEINMNFKYKENKNFIYLLLLLALSGNPFFSLGDDNSQYIFVGFVFLLSIKHYTYFNIKRAKLFFVFILFFISIFFFQKVVLGFVSIPGAIGFILKITFGFIVIRFIGARFKITYFKVIYFISIISLIGYLWTLLGFDIPNLLSDSSNIKSIVLFTKNSDGLRNSGMFWEPGAFASYICLGLLLFLGNIRKLLQFHLFKVFIILIALITTYSTTGYLVLFIIGLATIFLEYSKKYKIFVLPFVFVFLYIVYSIYQNTEFLKDKIDHQLEDAIINNGNDFSPDRFGAFFFDLHYIEKHPLVGNGMDDSTRFADHAWLQGEKLGHGNGFSNFLATMGGLSFLFYSFYIIKYKHQHPWIFLITIFILLQGEQLMNFPLFLSLPFIFIYENYYSRSNYLP